jgi:hypothetical protein
MAGSVGVRERAEELGRGEEEEGSRRKKREEERERGGEK